MAKAICSHVEFFFLYKAYDDSELVDIVSEEVHISKHARYLQNHYKATTTKDKLKNLKLAITFLLRDVNRRNYLALERS